jgi:hypothetical protein
MALQCVIQILIFLFKKKDIDFEFFGEGQMFSGDIMCHFDANFEYLVMANCAVTALE